MNLPINTNSGELTMSSLEIAELIDKRHDHVLADIRKMLAGLGLSAPDFSGSYRNSRGYTYPCFNLPRRECMLLIAGYRVKHTDAFELFWKRMELQRNTRRERQAQGIAKNKSKFKGRPANKERHERIRRLLGTGKSYREIAEVVDASISTISRVANAKIEQALPPQAQKANTNKVEPEATAPEVEKKGAAPHFVSGKKTMSSLEIAELAEKRHDHVIRDIRSMLDQLEHAPEVGAVSKVTDRHGNTLEFSLDRYHTEVLITGYDVNRRAAVIKRWFDLESMAIKSTAPALPDFTNPAAAARAWADELEGKQEAMTLIEQQKPAVEFAKLVASSTKGIEAGAFAKSIGVGRNTLLKILRQHGIFMIGSGDSYNLPLQKYVDRGYFNVRLRPYDINGKELTSFSPLFTGKGGEWLINKSPAAKALKLAQKAVLA